VVVQLRPSAMTRPDTSSGGEPYLPSITCGFVNNMPDGAFDATERQFLRLLEAGSGSELIDVRRYTVAGVPRGKTVAAKIAEHYAPAAAIRHEPPDLLIVTGSNPVEARLEDEPYWTDLVDLLTWGSQEVPSMFLSCLSAHAALTIFDGIERGRLASKCTGVFTQHANVMHPLTAGLDPEVVLPHSRTSAVPEVTLRLAGYDIAIHSEAVGWSVATKDVGASKVVLVQGHPEYDPSSLLREYHRDARRYTHFEKDELPCLPLHCVAAEDWDALQDLHHAITGNQRDPAVLEAYPFEDVGARAPWPWDHVATTLYANWLSVLTKRSDRAHAR
jgi:homoserine O-succinyltransferase/O-acetyltransferase